MTETIVRYNKVARALHWGIALLVIGNVPVAKLHEAYKDAAWIMPLHKTIGITVFCLTLFRLYWRFTHKVPPLPASLPKWQVGAAHLVHWAFYALILLIPLSGMVLANAARKSSLAGFAHEAHEIFAQTMIPLLIIHIVAALHHHLVLKNNVLLRMTGRPLRD